MNEKPEMSVLWLALIIFGVVVSVVGFIIWFSMYIYVGIYSYPIIITLMWIMIVGTYKLIRSFEIT